MRALLGLFLALFALTAAVPAAAAHASCPMGSETMQGMAMASGKAGSQDPCCDHAGKACALACDVVCGATMIAPASLDEQAFAQVPAAVTPVGQRQPPSLDLATIDPPPKPIV